MIEDSQATGRQIFKTEVSFHLALREFYSSCFPDKYLHCFNSEVESKVLKG